jgi:hypothetical protein
MTRLSITVASIQLKVSSQSLLIESNRAAEMAFAFWRANSASCRLKRKSAPDGEKDNADIYLNRADEAIQRGMSDRGEGGDKWYGWSVGRKLSGRRPGQRPMPELAAV